MVDGVVGGCVGIVGYRRAERRVGEADEDVEAPTGKKMELVRMSLSRVQVASLETKPTFPKRTTRPTVMVS